MKAVTYKPKAVKALRRMPRDQAELVRSKVRQYAADPASLANNVTELKGRAGLRLRVGNWRVIMDEDATVVDVLDVGPRGAIYG